MPGRRAKLPGSSPGRPRGRVNLPESAPARHEVEALPPAVKPSSGVKEGEARFRLLADQAPLLIWMSGPDKLCTWFNRPWLEFTGRLMEQCLANGWTDDVHPEDLPARLETYSASFDARRPFKMEYRLHRHDGQWRWMLDHAIPAYAADGSFAGYIGSCVDVTDRRRDQEALGISEETLREQTHILDKAQVMVCDLAGRITLWNEGSARMYAWSREEAVGRVAHELLRTQFPLPLPSIQEQLERDGAWYGELVQQRKDGSTIVVASHWTLHRDAEGEPRSVLVVDNDITRLKLAEGSRQESEAKLRALVQTAVDAIITIDDRGLIQSVNPATERMFGYTASDLIGQNVKMLMPLPYRKEHDGYLARHLKTGEKHIIGIGREVQAQRKDGSVFPADLAVSEVEPRKLFTGIIRDVSERKLSESRLRENDRMATIGTLAAGLGHDMNNVLLPVRAHLNALRAAGTDGAITPVARHHVEAVAKSVTYLQQLADGLHFLAMDPDNEETETGVTDLGEWWSQAGTIISKAVPKHVKVTAAFPPDLPKTRVAAHRLTQAVLNLVVNAGDAIPASSAKGRGRVRIWADLEARTGQDAHVRVGVTDNGTGMPEDVKRRALDLFFTTKPRGMGTGLGLALVQKVAQSAGGSVHIDSAVGKGTTVIMRLAVQSEQRAGGPAQRKAAISIPDGRAAALIGHLLESSGVTICAEDVPADAEIWIVDPAATDPTEVRRWRTRWPQGRLVLFGQPDAHLATEWASLDHVVIEAPDDFETVRAAVSRALSVE